MFNQNSDLLQWRHCRKTKDSAAKARLNSALWSFFHSCAQFFEPLRGQEKLSPQCYVVATESLLREAWVVPDV